MIGAIETVVQWTRMCGRGSNSRVGAASEAGLRHVRKEDEVECNMLPFQANLQVEVAHGQRTLIEEREKLVGPG